jgi:hypothetical protein
MPQHDRRRIRHSRMASRGLALQALLPVWGLLLAIIAGCGGPQDAELLVYRQRFLLESRPTEARSPAEARDTLQDSQQVVLLGRARFPEAAGDSADRAMFVLTELSDHDQQGGHDAANCPFCKRRTAKAVKAAVQFVDEAGEVLPFSVERLFEFSDGDVVVVRGRGEWNEPLNLVSVTADGVFVERPAD